MIDSSTFKTEEGLLQQRADKKAKQADYLHVQKKSYYKQPDSNLEKRCNE